MLKIEGRTFMNIQEAVQWLLDNNVLPFQCTANYQANTEIGLGTIVNPTPAKVRIGSLIFFADSKVSTVVGITDTGFICSDKYNNLVDDIAYVTNVAINGSGHLITTLSDGQTIDAGIIKQVSSFSINGSQHLIATYNDGTTNDLGAIFSGNIIVSGNLTVSGGISGNAVTGDSIIENMSGYAGAIASNISADVTLTPIFAGAVKNGNKVTFCLFGKISVSSASVTTNLYDFTIPSAVGNKLYPITFAGSSQRLETKNIYCAVDNYTGVNTPIWLNKISNTTLRVGGYLGNLTVNTDYIFRFECTFLLNDPLN